MKAKQTRSNRSTDPAAPPPEISRKIRSGVPRRRLRYNISPVLWSILDLKSYGKCKSGVAVPKDWSSCSRYGDAEASCDSNIAVETKKNKRSTVRKRDFGEISGVNEEFRRFTRSYYKQKEIERKLEAEVSDSSCVESHSGVDVKFCGEKSLRSKKKSDDVEEIEENEGSVAVALSEITCVGQSYGEVLKSGAGNANNSSVIEQKTMVSLSCSATESYSEVNFVKSLDKPIQDGENSARRIEFSEISRNCADTFSNSELTINQNEEFFKFASDLTCNEELAYDDKSEHSSETAFSVLQSEIFQEYSDLDFSDCSSIFTSGSEFSERSIGDSTPSPTFSLLLEYRQQFSRSTTPQPSKVSTHSEDNFELRNMFQFAKLEDEDDEESYQLLRNRERKAVFLHNYADEYESTTEYGQLVIQQRSKTVHWMVAQCSALELQDETLFLGVSLLDRFLSKGFFKRKRDLQIVGIACLTLATRIEENQPYNRIRKKSFYIGKHVYKRFEVVAMEWLVQEVLNFQCFFPTIYNFLWFYLKAARADTEMEKNAKYLAVLLLSETEQLSYCPSTIAASVVMLASTAGNEIAPERVMKTHVRTNNDDLSECAKSLSWLLKYIC